MPPEIWGCIRTIRDTMLCALEDLAPPQLSYVFTNTLETDEESKHLFARIERIARQRGATFLPVFLTRDMDEQLRRVSSPDRVARLKLSDPYVARAYITSAQLLVPSGPDVLTLDTTALSPERAADAIVLQLSRVEQAET